MPEITPQCPPPSWECELLFRWQIHPLLVQKLIQIAPLVYANTGRCLTVISGYRTCAHQMELAKEGRPAAPCDQSTHTVCPSTGVDIQLGIAPTRAQKALLGSIAVHAGLRWGGGSKVDDGGLPSDWNHFDLGPRR